MRFMRLLLPFLLLSLLLTGVARAEPGGSVTLPDGETVLIRPRGSETDIILQSGASVTRSQAGNASSWSAAPSVSSQDLDKANKAYDLWVRQNPIRRPANPGKILAGIFLVILGGLGAAFPYAAWYLRDGWRFKDAEPSDAALVMARLGGGVAVVIGLFVLFI